MSDIKTVTVQPVPGSPTTTALQPGEQTVGDALDEAGVKYGDDHSIEVDGQEVDENHEIEDGDRIMVTQNISGAK